MPLRTFERCCFLEEYFKFCPGIPAALLCTVYIEAGPQCALASVVQLRQGVREQDVPQHLRQRSVPQVQPHPRHQPACGETTQKIALPNLMLDGFQVTQLAKVAEMVADAVISLASEVS